MYNLAFYSSFFSLLITTKNFETIWYAFLILSLTVVCSCWWSLSLCPSENHSIVLYFQQENFLKTSLIRFSFIRSLSKNVTVALLTLLLCECFLFLLFVTAIMYRVHSIAPRYVSLRLCLCAWQMLCFMHNNDNA